MWRVSSYETQGSSHQKHNTPCQDKTWNQTNGEVYVAALADGAGSAKYSQYGADCVTRSVSAYLIDRYDDIINNPDGVEVKKELLGVLRHGLGLLADEMKCKSSDLASTLQAVAVKDDTYLLIHLGDGVIGYEKGEDIHVASEPTNGEFSNQTTFVTSPDAPVLMKIFRGSLGDIDGFILMSDGTANALYDKRLKRLAPSVKSLFDWTGNFTDETVRKNLRSSFENSIKKMTSDDCSVLIMKKAPALKSSNTFPLPRVEIEGEINA